MNTDSNTSQIGKYRKGKAYQEQTQLIKLRIDWITSESKNLCLQEIGQ